MNIANLIRKDLKKLTPYKPSLIVEEIGREIGIPPEKIIKIDSGENPYMEKFQKKNNLKKVLFYTYPDPFCTKLRAKIAKYLRVKVGQIVCGNGSDELIDLLIRTLVSKDEEIIINPPTFLMYEFYGKLSGIKVVPVLRDKNLIPDVKRILKAISYKTKIIFIDSPGNPTSAVLPNSAIEKLLKRKIIVVSDEAYFEYSGKSALPLINKYPNLVILRTFSKWAGLAGLRLGYAIANPEIIRILQTVKPPYNVNSLVQEVACNVLDDSKKYLEEIQKIISIRNWLVDKLREITDLNVYSSAGAYILLRGKGSSLDLQTFLKGKGVLVKVINYPLLKDYIRINVVKKKEAELLLSFLREYYE